MFRFFTRHAGKFLFLSMVAVLMVACGGGKREATATAKAFLQAYYVDLDFNKVISLSSESSLSAIEEHAEMIALNPYAKEESPDIVWVDLVINGNDSELATCTYTCNRVEKTLPLHKINGEWKVDLNGSTVETYGSVNNFMEFSPTNQGGFAASCSGEIKYKKRRQNNK